MLIEVLKQARKECSIEREFSLYPYLDAYRERSAKTGPFALFLEKLMWHWSALRKKGRKKTCNVLDHFIYIFNAAHFPSEFSGIVAPAVLWSDIVGG